MATLNGVEFWLWGLEIATIAHLLVERSPTSDGAGIWLLLTVREVEYLRSIGNPKMLFDAIVERRKQIGVKGEITARYNNGTRIFSTRSQDKKPAGLL